MNILSSAISPVFRQFNRLSRYPISSNVFHVNFSNPVKCFQNSSVKNGFEGGTFYNVSPKKETRLKVKDSVPSDYELIYLAPMALIFRTAYPITCFCIVTVPAIAFYKYFSEGRLELATQTGFLGPLQITNAVLELSIFSGALVLFAMAAFAIMFKYPFRIYRHNVKEEYIAMFLSVIPLNVKLSQCHFKTASHIKFKNPFYFFMKDCQFNIGEKKTLLYPHYFRTPKDFCNMISQK